MDNIARQRLLALKAQQKQKELHDAHTAAMTQLKQDIPDFGCRYRLANPEETAITLAIAGSLPYSAPGQPTPLFSQPTNMDTAVLPTYPVHLVFLLGNEALANIVLEGAAQDILHAREDWESICPRLLLIDQPQQIGWILDFEDGTVSHFKWN